MGRDIRIAFRGLDSIDWSRAVKVLRPQARPSFPGTDTATRMAIEAFRSGSGGAFVGSMDQLKGPPTAKILMSGIVAGSPVRPAVTDFTIAPGLVGSAGALFQGSAGGGIYWWIKPAPPCEVGLWGSVGVSVTSNMGFAAGGMISVWYGPAPVVLAGESLGVSVDVSVGALTVTGMMMFSVPPGGLLLTPGMKVPGSLKGWKPELIGLGFAVQGGWSVLPLDISVGPSHTWIKPL